LRLWGAGWLRLPAQVALNACLARCSERAEEFTSERPEIILEPTTGQGFLGSLRRHHRGTENMEKPEKSLCVLCVSVVKPIRCYRDPVAAVRFPIRAETEPALRVAAGGGV